jgi:hypothetical protein
MTDAAKPLSLAARIDAIEEAYEFMLAYAAQGRMEEGDHALSQVRALMTGAANALEGIGDAALAATATHPARAKCAAFIDVLSDDARRSLAVLRLTLSAKSISSQLVDNLNGSIHLRALLTDIFVIDEFLKGA